MTSPVRYHPSRVRDAVAEVAEMTGGAKIQEIMPLQFDLGFADLKRVARAVAHVEAIRDDGAGSDQRAAPDGAVRTHSLPTHTLQPGGR